MELTELTTTEETPTDTIQTISGHSKVTIPFKAKLKVCQVKEVKTKI